MTRKPEMRTRAAPINGTANAEERTVEIAFASEAPVKRFSWDEGFYLEVLSINKNAIDTSRMDTMSLLDTHDQYSLESRLGSVVPGSFRIEAGKALCRVKFSRNPKAEVIFTDILDGHTVPVSVGYRVLETTKADGAGDALPTLTATRWMPMEVSLVPVPADSNAHTRSEGETEMPVPMENEQHRYRETNLIRERKRQKDIREFATLTRGVVTSDEIERALDGGTDIETLRELYFEREVNRQSQATTFPMVETHGMGHDDGAREARIEALACRMNGGKPSDHARQFMSWTLEQHARASLEANGVNTRNLSRNDVFGGGGGQRSYAPHTTSDFPLLLQSAGERVLMAQYEAAQSPIKQRLCRSTTMSDFRKAQKIKIGDIDTLARLNEAGEIKATTRGEAAESYGLSTFARIFSLTRNALINDDLSGLADWSRAAGRAAAETENQIIVNLLLSNPTIGEDDLSLFHASHNNLALIGSPLSVDSLSDARKAMRKQKAFGGKLPAGVTPSFLVVGPELETDAEKILATLSATTANDVNPFSNRLELLVEPRIEDRSWFVFASPTNAPVLEYAHLSSAPGPQVAYQEGFETLGVDYRVVLDFGAGVVDFRGAYRNPGK